ncbi:hypothetical protein H4Q26_014167 [Puccinia striiformis f. sp. tritici PST-130]|nr:hypothetical protein H4Q26_014167 [Puccinia striiformis f. sp. tritici PST-130]
MSGLNGKRTKQSGFSDPWKIYMKLISKSKVKRDILRNVEAENPPTHRSFINGFVLTFAVFSTVPEWQSYYVSYDSLKATIYKLEKDQAAKHQSNLRLSSTSQNQSDLNYRDPSTAEHSLTLPFSHSVRSNLLRIIITRTYKSRTILQTKQDELIDELNGLTNEIETIEKQGIQLVQDSFNQSTVRTKRRLMMRMTMRRTRTSMTMTWSRCSGGINYSSSRISPSNKRQQLLKSASIFGILPILGFSSKTNSTSNRRSTSLGRSRVAQRSLNLLLPNLHFVLLSTYTIDLPLETQIFLVVSLSGFQTHLDPQEVYHLVLKLNSIDEHNRISLPPQTYLKKYDKVFESSLSYHFLEETLIHQSKAFNPTTISQLQAHLDSLFPIYARLITQGDEEMAKKQLNAHLREQVVWERNTIWRDMIGMERKGWANSNRTIIGKPFARTNNDNNDNPQSLMAILNLWAFNKHSKT